MKTLKIDNPIKDWPYAELADAAREHVKNGWKVDAKFTCCRCGSRVVGLGMAILQICDLCGVEHDFQKSGGNYIMEKEFRHD